MSEKLSEGTVASAWAAGSPGLDVRPIEVFGRLRRLQELHDQALEPLYDGAPLSQSEVGVLILLRHAQQPLIARQLARQRGCSRAAMGKLLAKIEKRGLVARHPNPADRRAALVEITEKGRELVDEIFPRQLELEARILESFDETWRENFIASLDELSRRIAETKDIG